MSSWTRGAIQSASVISRCVCKRRSRRRNWTLRPWTPIPSCLVSFSTVFAFSRSKVSGSSTLVCGPLRLVSTFRRLPVWIKSMFLPPPRGMCTSSTNRSVRVRTVWCFVRARRTPPNDRRHSRRSRSTISRRAPPTQCQTRAARAPNPERSATVSRSRSAASTRRRRPAKRKRAAIPTALRVTGRSPIRPAPAPLPRLRELRRAARDVLLARPGLRLARWRNAWSSRGSTRSSCATLRR
mmetsp:Transcript_16751/g.42817  ORF Transcript_16751/g.42817 Transcript_16751/m.42817 type:complete len:239 (+) Transcript_16751:237-953(+)